MSEITRLLSAIEQGDPSASAQLLLLIYDELRLLVEQKLAQEKPGQRLNAAALVLDAYLRLVDNGHEQSWERRGHFFSAAAHAIRRILVESARRKQRPGHSEGVRRHDISAFDVALPQTSDDLIALSEALDRLQACNAEAAELFNLRFFAGLNNEQVAAALGITPRKANQVWAYARAWLLENLGQEPA
jgi:RNA polymerase sigma factor (TIGR02999 family)